MNRKQLVRGVAAALRERGVRKIVNYPKQVFHISDDNGNHKDFVVHQSERKYVFSIEDVDAILDVLLDVIKDALKQGDHVSVRGFGTLYMKYRKARRTKDPVNGEWVDIAGRFTPKFDFGNDLRYCARIYEAYVKERGEIVALPPLDDEDGEDDVD